MSFRHAFYYSCRISGSKRDVLTRDIDDRLNNLSNICAAVLVFSIRNRIHLINHRLYESLCITKHNKFLSLVGVNHNQSVQHTINHNVASHSVVNIPEDLSLSDYEISVLSKGLNFDPVANKSDEFQVKKFDESYFCRTRLNRIEWMSSLRILSSLMLRDFATFVIFLIFVLFLNPVLPLYYG